MKRRFQFIDKAIEESIALKRDFDDSLKEGVLSVVNAIVEAHREKRRVFAFGNGGSAADAQHFAAELVGRFLKEREPLDVHALTTNSSTLTCLVNDSLPELLFARQVKAHVGSGDILLGISTSGASPNVVNGLIEGRKTGAVTVGLTGQSSGLMQRYYDILLQVPSEKTPRVQESHIFVIHLICEMVENAIMEESAG